MCLYCRPLGHKVNNSSENMVTPGLNSHSYMHNTPADYKQVFSLLSFLVLLLLLVSILAAASVASVTNVIIIVNACNTNHIILSLPILIP